MLLKNNFDQTRLILLLIATILIFSIAQVHAEEDAKPEETGKDRIAEMEEKRGAHYARRLAQFIEDSPNRPKGKIVFVGDSITEGFPLEQGFPNGAVINRGIGGDKVLGVVDRLDVSITDLEPSKVYLMIGTNNLAWFETNNLEETKPKYRELFEKMKKAAPDAEFFIQSILPVGQQYDVANPYIIEANAFLKALAEEFGFEWVDLHSHFINENGLLNPNYTTDGVHLTIQGYLTWMEQVFDLEDFLYAVENLYPRVESLASPHREADRMDPAEGPEYGGHRGPNELVVYTPSYGSDTTKTNPWGIEAVISNGEVAELGGNNHSIPENGFVISGHGSSAAWISANLSIGAQVSLEGGVVHVVQPSLTSSTEKEQLERMRTSLLIHVFSGRATDPEGAEKLLREIVTIRKGEKPIGLKKLAELRAEYEKII